jgi:hypothetical protein
VTQVTVPRGASLIHPPGIDLAKIRQGVHLGIAAIASLVLREPCHQSAV